MIKKVRVKDLRPGNFIHDFNCGWNGGNIYIDQTLIHDRKIIDIIRSWGIREVYIDTDRGLDVEELPRAKNPEPSESSAVPPARRELPPHVNPAPPEIPLAVEMKTATQIKNDAANVLEYNLDRLQQGQSPDVDLTYELTRKMRESISRNRDALLLLTRIRQKDEYTLYHSISVSSLVLDMCNFKGIPERQALDLAVGALLHDIGKTQVPQHILNKPTRLTEDEYSEMKKHSEYSVNLLQNAKNLPFECYDIALHHHEKIDGSGYPHNLKEADISFGARLTAICDVFDAVTSNRCYKEGFGTVTGLQEIYQLSGSHFDKELSHEFIRCIGVYPVGSCVKLEDGKVGVVTDPTDNLLKPRIKVFYDGAKGGNVTPFSMDLSTTDAGIESYEEPGRFGITPDSLLTQMAI